MSKKKKENDWVTYPEINPTIDELKAHFEMQEDNQEKVIFTPKVNEEGRIDEFPALNPEDLQVPQLTTTPAEPEEVKTEEYSVEEMEVLKANLQETLEELEKDEHDKKNYIKISDTFYIQPIVKEEDEDEEVDEDGKVKELFKVLNPETDELETRELTDEEKKEILILELKRERIRFHPTKNPVRTTETTYVEKKYGKKTIKVKEKTKGVITNETVNQFGAEYKQKRKRKNQQRKTSRKANR